MANNYSQTWNLDSIFPGGSSSPQFASFMEETESTVSRLLKALQDIGQESANNETLTEWTSTLQDVLSRFTQAEAFVSCLAAQDMGDKRAVAWTERVQTLSARFNQVLDLYDAQLAAVSQDRWKEWIADPRRSVIAFPLSERREAVKDKMPPALEAVASELAVNGYHGWGEHYNTIVGRISIPWEQNGATVSLSAGQAFNKLEDPDPAVRRLMSARWEEAWDGQADLCSDSLNRLAGFRLKLYGMRGWDDPLREPLKINRMSRETLDAMWSAVAEGLAPLKRYLDLKARRMGKDRLAWHDVDAPIASTQSKIPFDEAAQLIIDAFGQFSPEMARFAQRAFDQRWIEAEDRAGKRPGGFCTSLPRSGESRIFMTYSGTPGNVSTLAHELGHAYHSSLVMDLPPFAQGYAMNVAETASTFAEALVNEALLRRSTSDEEKLALLDDSLQRAVAFCMNIRARFIFENRFYERRASGMVEAAELNELMTAAQKEAYGDVLGNWHPHFWASKMHFYLTDVPFYNFPYTFGYLFSTGLVAVAEREGDSFRERYDRLLRDTGVMTVEGLASSHLGVSLERLDFWKQAMSRVAAHVDAFEKLCR